MGRHTELTKGFTDKYIQNLKPKDKGYIQREGRGFAIRVRPTGFKTFLYAYTWEGQQKYLNLGSYPAVSVAEARAKYHTAYTKVQNKQNPVLEAHVEEVACTTFRNFCQLYLDWSEHAHVPLWHANITSCLTNDVLPVWGELEIRSISKRAVITLLETVQKRAPGRVPSLQRAISGVFTYALERDYVDYNPSTGLSRAVPSLKVKPRQRVLTDEELRHVWSKLGTQRTHQALRVILFTAQRPGEVAGLHRREIHGDVWTIPQERAEKGQGDHTVHLTKTVLDMIRDTEGDTDGYIFGVARNSISRTVQQTNNFFGLPRWTPHDLRRTARTIMARIGIIDEHAEAVIAHKKKGIKAVYNQYDYYEEKKAALIRLEQELLRILHNQ